AAPRSATTGRSSPQSSSPGSNRSTGGTAWTLGTTSTRSALGHGPSKVAAKELLAWIRASAAAKGEPPLADSIQRMSPRLGTLARKWAMVGFSVPEKSGSPSNTQGAAGQDGATPTRSRSAASQLVTGSLLDMK